MDDWRQRLIEGDEEALAALIRSSRCVAVLGIKPETRSHKAAFYVAAALQRHGVEVVPVPVYYPEVVAILGQKVFRRVADVPRPIDIVDVFRRSHDVPPHVADIIEARPRAVWLQSGIRNDEAAEAFARKGILVVQDRCLMVDWERYGADGSKRLSRPIEDPKLSGL